MGPSRKLLAVALSLVAGLVASVLTPDSWTPVALAASCSPGSETYSLDGVNYQVLAFTSTDSCDWSVPAGVTEIDLLVVGGGGAGGGLGGGGAGEFVQHTSLAVSGVITVSVGSGGPAVGGSTASARNGGSSTFGSITAAGGGGGGLANGGDGAAGADGASGGGGARNDGFGGATQDDGDPDSFGNDGARGWGTRNPTIGGAGGGAGAAPVNAVATVAVDNGYGTAYTGLYTDGDAGVVSLGGDGKASSIVTPSIATSLSIGDVSGSDVYFAGGGGGGCGVAAGGNGCANAAITGGLGGGGDGSGGPGDSATGGGGAGSSGINGAGGAGGSGVVIVRYVLIDPEDSASSSRSSGDDTSGTPGIFLSVQAPLGSPITGTTVACGAFSVKPNSPYVLTLDPRDGRFPPRVLAQGFVDTGGHLEREISLPFLAAGSYDLVFSGVAISGAELRLANVIVVAESGVTVSKTPENLQPVTR